jgi:hypothetical protein
VDVVAVERWGPPVEGIVCGWCGIYAGVLGWIIVGEMEEVKKEIEGRESF